MRFGGLHVVVVSAILVGLGAVSACGGIPGTGDGDDDDDSSSPTPSSSPSPTNTAPVEYGGYVSLGQIRVEIDGQAASVQGFAAAGFYEPTTFDTTGTLPGLDECVVNTPQPAPTASPLQYRDAGDTLTLSGPASLTLYRTLSSGSLVYVPSPNPPSAGSVVAGGQYDVSWSGGPDVGADTLAGVLVVPDAVQITSPDISNLYTVGGGALSVSWTGAGSTGSSSTWLMMTTVDPNNTGNWASALCVVNDDGSFTIPSGVVSQLPAGVGNMGIYRALSNEPSLSDGSVLVVQGVWEHFGPIQK